MQHPLVLYFYLLDLAFFADDFLDPADVDLILPLPLLQLQLAQGVEVANGLAKHFIASISTIFGL